MTRLTRFDVRRSPLLAWAVLAFVLSTRVAAMSWPDFMPPLDSLVVRADNSDSSSTEVTVTPTSPSSSATETNSSSETTTNTDASTTGSAQSKTTDKSASNTKTDTDTASKTATNTDKTSKSTKTTSTSTSIDPRLPAGGIQLITPAATTTTYYKIGDYVTFVWNYTSLSVTPSYIDVFATCTANEAMYTLAVNQTVGDNGTDAVTWDTGGYQATATVPLLTQTYTLIIFDAQSSISATAHAGYLAVFDTYSFGMYVPQPYVPLSEFQCATCSGALSSLEHNALSFVMIMSVITVASFTWFVTGSVAI